MTARSNDMTAEVLDRCGASIRAGYANVEPCHDLAHVIRVATMCERLAVDVGVDRRAAAYAGLLHDIGHGSHLDHATLSAEHAHLVMGEAGEPAALIAEVIDAIRTHRYSTHRDSETSLLGHCLRDADRLDALGLVGVARAFLWIGAHGWTGRLVEDPQCPQLPARALREHWEEKLRHLPALMHTELGREIAQNRAQAMLDVLLGLEAELAT